MATSKDILVPVDGSKPAMRALEHAISIAAGTGGTIHLLNVEAPVDQFGLVPAYITVKRHREMTRERALKVLAPAVKRVTRARLRHEPHVEWGDTAEVIGRVARKSRCGSIVMGTRGLNAARSLIMGSVSMRVIQLADVPVTLVR